MQPHEFLRTYHTLGDHVVALIRATPLFYLQIIALVAWMVLFLSLRPLFKQRRKILISALFVLLGVACVLLGIKYHTINREYLVISQEQAPALSGPGEDFTVLGHLPPGTEVAKLEQVGDFMKVACKGKVFWVKSFLGKGSSCK